MGGDEFSILIINTPETKIVELFEVLQQDWKRDYNKKYAEDAEHPAISLSIGIYIFAGSHDLSWDEAYQQADKALYAAKDNGRDQIKLFKHSINSNG